MIKNEMAMFLERMCLDMGQSSLHLHFLARIRNKTCGQMAGSEMRKQKPLRNRKENKRIIKIYN